jgi:hypothetical protein
MSEMIERVARAIFNEELVREGKPPLSDKSWDGVRRIFPIMLIPQARAAIEAMREYSNEMYVAAASVSSASDQDIINIWQAMIDAALAETAVTQEK